VPGLFAYFLSNLWVIDARFLPEIVDRQISIISKIPFRNRYLDIQLRFSYIPLIQEPRLYLPILSYHRLI